MRIFDVLIKHKIPIEVFGFNKKIMHITDTPDITFSYIKKLIRIIEPDIIIHTGDLVDNIKLEISRSNISNYERRVKSLLNILRSTKPEKIILCKGNHDDEAIIKKYLSNGEFLYDRAVVDIDNRKYLVSHYGETSINEEVDYFLYGHSPDFPSDKSREPIYLNGMAAIYVIDSLSGEIVEIPYPRDTDYFRQRKFKLGF